MAKGDLEKMSVAQLKALQEQVEQTIEVRRDTEKTAVRDKVIKLIEDAGFTFEEIFGKPRGKKTALPPKYRNPNNASQTWSGRGRRPQWLDQLMAKGKKQEEFLIK
jgi:DNA-binding protein H-NS